MDYIGLSSFRKWSCSFRYLKLNLGTMYNKVLKDITNRFKIIQGYKVNFINGFDCYGVEIEDSAMSMGKVI